MTRSQLVMPLHLMNMFVRMENSILVCSCSCLLASDQVVLRTPTCLLALICEFRHCVRCFTWFASSLTPSGKAVLVQTTAPLLHPRSAKFHLNLLRDKCSAASWMHSLKGKTCYNRTATALRVDVLHISTTPLTEYSALCRGCNAWIRGNNTHGGSRPILNKAALWPAVPLSKCPSLSASVPVGFVIPYSHQLVTHAAARSV